MSKASLKLLVQRWGGVADTGSEDLRRRERNSYRKLMLSGQQLSHQNLLTLARIIIEKIIFVFWGNDFFYVIYKNSKSPSGHWKAQWPMFGPKDIFHV